MKNQDAMDGLDVNDPELRAAMMSAGSTLGPVADRRAIIVINAQGIMQLTNQVIVAGILHEPLQLGNTRQAYRH
jgi:hypothetical protein